MRIASLLLFLAIGVLIWLNPDRKAFKEYAEARSERILLRETGDTELGRFLSSAGGALAGAFIDRITERRTFVLFSTYTIDLNGDEEHKQVWRFLGIAGQFIELEKPEALREAEQDRP